MTAIKIYPFLVCLVIKKHTINKNDRRIIQGVAKIRIELQTDGILSIFTRVQKLYLSSRLGDTRNIKYLKS